MNYNTIITKMGKKTTGNAQVHGSINKGSGSIGASGSISHKPNDKTTISAQGNVTHTVHSHGKPSTNGSATITISHDF